MARQDLYFFARWMFLQRKGYTWQRAPHHKVICDALMRVYWGECRRLIINIPPRYSKTELAVVNFIAWTLGKNPDSEYIHTSYSSALAIENAGNVKELVMHPAYREIFPEVAIRSDARADQHWKTTRGGTMYSAGMEGSITGYGAGKMRDEFGGALIIDDPHKADEARSDTIRNKVISHYPTTLDSRKNDPERTPVILMMQRLHEEDLAGWLLAGNNGEEWENICLPAIKEDGTALWPEKHPIEKLLLMERAAPYMFAGQYRQAPSPPAGNIFTPDQIRIVDAIPAGQIEWVRGWDLGSTMDGDWTAGGLLGRLPDKRFIIADMRRLRERPEERDKAIYNAAAGDGDGVTVGLPQDPGQAGKTQVQYMAKELAGFTVKTSPESGDKIVRAEPFAAQVNVGNVLMLRGPWNKELTDEMRVFPNGKYDDQVDSLSRAFMELIGGTTGMLDWLSQTDPVEDEDAPRRANDRTQHATGAGWGVSTGENIHHE